MKNKKKLINLILGLMIAIFSSYIVPKIKNDFETKVNTKTKQLNIDITEIPEQNNKKEFINGKVIKVYDGDTITVLNENSEKMKIRMYGIDAPELKQKDGKFVRDKLNEYLIQSNVQVEVFDTDRYGRTVAKVYYKGQNINLWLLENGKENSL